MFDEEKMIADKEKVDSLPKVDLGTVTEVRLPNGHVYVKYNTLNSDIPILLRVDGSNKSVKDIIEGIQQSSNDYNSKIAINNTYDILSVEKKYVREEIKLVPVEFINNNEMFTGLNDYSKKIISYYLNNKNKFQPKLKYINFKELIAINEDGNVITCYYDSQTDKYFPKFADTVKYSNTVEQVKDNSEGGIVSIDYDDVLDRIENNNEEIEVFGEKINVETLENYDSYPELIDRKTMSDHTRDIIRNLILKYRLRKNMREQQSKQIDPPKIKSYKINPGDNRAAFANQILIAFLSGFATAIIISLIIFMIMRLFN